MTDQLDPSELAYLDRCRADLARARSALDSFGAHLAVKYTINQGDKIGSDGSILRAVAPPEEVSA